MTSWWPGDWWGIPGALAVCGGALIVVAALGVGELLRTDRLGAARTGEDQPGVPVARRLRRLAALQSLICLIGGALAVGHAAESSSGWATVLDSGGELPSGIACAVAAGLAAAIVVGTVRAPRSPALVGLLVLQLAVPLPLAAVVAETVERSPDIVGGALALLLTSALLWLGGLAAFLPTARPASNDPCGALRYPRLTAWILPLVGAAGGVLISYASTVEDPFDSERGWLVLLGVPAVIVTVGRVVRRPRRALLRERRRRGWLPLVDLLRLTASLALVLAVASALPAAAPDTTPSGLLDMIGYELPMHLTATDLLVRWRPDLLFGPLAVVAGALYVGGVRRLPRDVRWPSGRIAAWLAGCGFLLVTTSSGIASYAPVAFSVAMAQHVLLMTVVPGLLVLGHPLSLLREAGPSRAVRVARELVASRPYRLATHPLGAWLLVAAVLFGLFPTGLYATLLPWHWAHYLMSVAFLVAGLAQFCAVLGESAGSRRPPIVGLVMVFALMGLHAGFGVWLLAQPAALAPEHFLELPVPYIADLVTDQRLGAIVGWVISEVATIVAVIVLVARWIRHDRHATEGPGDAARYAARHREQLFAAGPSSSRGGAGRAD